MKKLILTWLAIAAASAQAESVLKYNGFDTAGNRCSIAITFNSGDVTKLQLNGNFDVYLERVGEKATDPLSLVGAQTFEAAGNMIDRQGEFGPGYMEIRMNQKRATSSAELFFDEYAREVTYKGTSLTTDTHLRHRRDFSCKRLRLERLNSGETRCDAILNTAMRGMCQAGNSHGGINPVPPTVPNPPHADETRANR